MQKTPVERAIEELGQVGFDEDDIVDFGRPADPCPSDATGDFSIRRELEAPVK